MNPSTLKSAPLASLYWLTHESDFNCCANFIKSVEYALQQGLGWLQYRHKNDARPNVDLLKELQPLCATYHTKFIINDYLSLAAELNCGVHLGKQDLSVILARAQLHESALIGASCYQDLSRAIELQPFCDYVAFGAFYPSSTKPNAAIAPLSLLTQARSQLDCSIAVIGGITPQNALPLLQAGADIIAVSAVLHKPKQFEKTLDQFATLFAYSV